MCLIARRGVLLGLAVCLASTAESVDAAEDETASLLQAFVDELVPITPGQGVPAVLPDGVGGSGRTARSRGDVRL